MTTPVWERPRAAISQISSLMTGKLRLDYVAWPLNEPDWCSHNLGKPAGLVALWPNQTITVPDATRTVRMLPVGNHTYRVLVRPTKPAERERLRSQLTLLVQRSQIGASLQDLWNRAETVWAGLSASQQYTILALQDAKARLNEVPVVFVLARTAPGERELQAQIWHPQMLPPSVALHLLQRIPRAEASANN